MGIIMGQGVREDARGRERMAEGAHLLLRARHFHVAKVDLRHVYDRADHGRLSGRAWRLAWGSPDRALGAVLCGIVRRDQR